MIMLMAVASATEVIVAVALCAKKFGREEEEGGQEKREYSTYVGINRALSFADFLQRRRR
jgi:hypothetical protein